MNLKLDVHRWETGKGNVFRFGGGGGDQKGKFQLFSLHYGCYRKGLAATCLASGTPWQPRFLNQQLAAARNPCSLPMPWLVSDPPQFPSVEEDAERHTTVSELIFPPQDSSLGISFQLRQPLGTWATCSSGFQLPKQTPANYTGNFRFNLGELEAHPEGGERTGRRRGAGRLRETAVALCPISQMCNSFLPCSRALALGMPLALLES